MNTFADVIDIIDEMPLEDQITLNDILNKRVSEAQREVLINTVFSSRKEYKNGKAKKASVDDIINEIMS
jgi:hypothetical protein